jgi:hypothetical protein
LLSIKDAAYGIEFQLIDHDFAINIVEAQIENKKSIPSVNENEKLKMAKLLY